MRWTAALLFCLLLPGCCPAAQRDFERALRLPWREVFADDFRVENDSLWHLDGLKGRIVRTDEGLEVHAGEELFSDSSHVVLWTRRMFRGDVKIEYDFTRLDTSREESVNILYLHAAGWGRAGCGEELMRWNDKRRVPAMCGYFDRMNLYHISYAVAEGDTLRSDYIRARRYMPAAGRGLEGTALGPEYSATGMFAPGVKHRIVVIKRGERLYMQVTNKQQQRLFWFDLRTHPALERGHLGLRQMWGRSSRYGHLSICELKE